MMLVSACEISRRSNCAAHRVLLDIGLDIELGMADLHQEHRLAHGSATSSPSITGFGMRAKRANSSTIRLMSSTWRTMVSVHCSKISLSLR